MKTLSTIFITISYLLLMSCDSNKSKSEDFAPHIISDLKQPQDENQNQNQQNPQYQNNNFEENENTLLNSNLKCKFLYDPNSKYKNFLVKKLLDVEQLNLINIQQKMILVGSALDQLLMEQSLTIDSCEERELSAFIKLYYGHSLKLKVSN